MRYFLITDSDDYLHFGSARDIFDDYGQVELHDIVEMYTATKNTFFEYDEDNRNFLITKKDGKENEKPEEFDSLEECVKYGMKVIFNDIMDKRETIERFFMGGMTNIKEWLSALRYL